MNHIDTTALVVAIGVLIPLFTGLVGRAKGEAEKASLSGLVAAASGGFATLLAEPNINWVGWLLSIGTTWLASIVADHGFWSPTGLVDRWVEWTARQLAKIGVDLPEKEAEDIVEWLHTVFGDSVEFLSEEEMRFRLGGHASPAPVSDDCAHADELHAFLDQRQATGECGDHADVKVAAPVDKTVLQGPGHNFTNEGAW